MAGRQQIAAVLHKDRHRIVLQRLFDSCTKTAALQQREQPHPTCWANWMQPIVESRMVVQSVLKTTMSSDRRFFSSLCGKADYSPSIDDCVDLGSKVAGTAPNPNVARFIGEPDAKKIVDKPT